MDQRLGEITEEMTELALFAARLGIDKVRNGEETTPIVVIDPMGEGERSVVTLPKLDPDATLTAIEETVRDQRYQAEFYAVCYDGYVRANGKEIDAIIVEFAENGAPMAHAIGLPYEGEGDTFQIEEQATYLGECPSHFFLAQM